VNDLTPYEQELANQLNHPPLPDENQAWQDMKKMLDQNNNKGGGRGPSSNRGMWGIALGILLLTIGILWFAHYKKQALLKQEDNKVRTLNDQASAIPTTNTKEATQTTPRISDNSIHSNAIKTGNDLSTEDKETANNSAPVKNGENKAGENNLKHDEPLSSGNETSTTKSSEENILSGNNTATLKDKNVLPDKTSSIAEHPFIPRTKFSRTRYKKGKSKGFRLISNKDDVTENTNSKNTKAISINEDEKSAAPIDQTTNSNTVANPSNNKKYVSKNSLHITSSKGPHVNVRKNYLNNSESTNENIATSANSKAHKKGKLVVNKAKDPHYHVKHFGAKGDETTTSIASATTDNAYQKPVRDTSTLQHKTIVDTSLFKPLATTTRKASDSTKSDSTKKDKKEDKKKNKPHFAAGIAAQQSVDKSCNCAYPDNLNAPASAKDYIPSAYLRYYDKKWFLQSEFKYAAPQYVNGSTYHVIENMPVVLNDTITTFTIKKIYGHQGSVSFHYFILPNVSIGTGLIYNIFSGADIQKDIQKKSFGPTDSLISSTMITDKDDSSFTGLGKNNLQLLLEVQYQWKRISVGASYAIGITPYIKYTDPYSGTPGQKENNSVNLFLRYDLWRRK
jgi:hypothetical protein